MLFDRDRTVISRHINNIYKEGELDKKSTCAKNAQVQNEGGREVTRKYEFYNLLEKFKWWDKTVEEIREMIPILTNSDLLVVREYLKKHISTSFHPLTTYINIVAKTHLG